MSIFAGVWWPEDEILEVLDRLAGGEPADAIARDFRVTEAQVLALQAGILEDDDDEEQERDATAQEPAP